MPGALSPSFDLVVIGSGPGGYVAAIRAAQLGLRTAVVEKDPKLGGTCLHRGCIPAKALLHAAHVVHLIETAEEFGIEVSRPRVNLEKVQAYKDRVVARMAAGIQGLFKKNMVSAFQGVGSLAGAGRVRVVSSRDETFLQAKYVLLATGSRVKSLQHLPLDGRAIISSDDIWSMTKIPESILIVGGGAIGVECATTFLRFGSKVTLVEILPRIVPLEDEEVSAELERSFRKQGIEILTGVSVKSARAGPEGRVAVELSGEGSARSAPTGGGPREVEKLLVAVGRAPVTEGLGLEGTGVRTDRGFVQVDEFMRTGEKNVYAIGDIVLLPALAHVASAAGILAVEHMAGRNPKQLDKTRIPNCTFSDPQIASIGLSDAEARKRGLSFKVSKFPFLAIGKSVILGVTEGFVKVVADSRYGEILGVHIIHPYASHLIGEAVAAMNGELPAEDLARSIHPHPTLSEGIMEAMHGIIGLPIHI